MAIVAKKKRGGAPRRRALPWAGAAVLVALAAVLAWRWAAGRSESSPHLAGEPPALPAESAAGRPEVAPYHEGEPAAESAAGRPEVAPYHEGEPPAAQEPQRIVPADRPGYYRLPDGTEFRFKLPPEGQTASLKVKGVLYRFDSEGNFADITKPKVFDNPVENQLVGLSVEGGSFAPGFLLRHSDEEILAALQKPVTINDDDPEDVKAKKEAVAAMKQEILAYMEQGGTYEDFVTEMASMARQERKMKRDGIRKIVSMLDEGRADEARDFYETYNKLLQESGYSALKLQMGLKERLGIGE